MVDKNSKTDTDDLSFKSNILPSFQQLVENAFEGIWILDADYFCIYINRRMCEILGRSEQEILHKNVTEFMFEEDLADHKLKVENRKKLEPDQYERRFKSKEGKEIWTLVSAKPLTDEHGNFSGSFTTFADISRSKERDRISQIVSDTQVKLAQIENIDQVYQLIGQRIREITQTGYVGTVDMDEKTNVMSINGLHGVELTYHNLVKQFNLDPTKIKYPLKDAPLNELEIFRMGKLCKFEGGLYPLLMKKVPKSVCLVVEKQMRIRHIMMMGLVTEGKHFGGVIILTENDISSLSSSVEAIVYQATQVIKRLRSEQNMRISEDRLRMTFDAINDGYWDWDIPSGEITVNDKWYTMLGYKPGEFASTYDNFIRLLHSEDLITTKAAIDLLLLEKSDYSVEFRLKMKDGGYKWILARGKIILSGDSGEPLRMVGTHSDISERKQFEQDRLLFYDTQRKLIQVTNLDELYQLVGNCLTKLLADGYVVFTRYDELAKLIKVVGFYGFGKNLDELLKLYRLSTSSFNVRIEDIDDDNLRLWRSNSLALYLDGLYGILTKKLPKTICKAVEKRLSIKEIYVMGCQWNELNYGGFVLLTRNGLGLTRELIETLINDTAIAIQRIITEEEVHIAQTRYRNIFEESPVGIVTVGADYKFMTANAEFCNICGYSQDELVNMTLKEITHPDFLEKDLENIGKLISGELDVYSTVKRYIRKDGQLVWVKLLVNKICDSQGKFLYLLEMITNINNEKVAEEAINENRHFLEMVLDTIPNLVFVRDEEGRYRLANKAFADAMGSTVQAINGKTDLDLGGFRELANTAHLQDLEVIKTGRDWINTEMEIYFPKSGSKTVQLVKRALLNAEEKIPEVLGVITDISLLTQIKKELQVSELKYRTLIQHIPVGVYQTDLHGKNVYFNDRLCEMNGLSNEEMMEKGWINGVYFEDRKRVSQLWDSFVHQGGKWSEEYRLQNQKTGRIIWVIDEAVALYDEDGNIIGHIGSKFNLTEQKETTTQLKKSEEKYRVLTENMKDVVWTLDTETLRFTYMSPSIEKLRGYSAEEVMASPLSAALTEEGARSFTQLIHQQVAEYRANRINSEKYFTYEIPQPKKDGSMVWTEVITNLQLNPDTGHLELNGATRDISERKKSEIERQVLFSIMQGTSSSKDLPQFLKLIHESIGKVIDARNISIVYYDKKTELFEEIYSVDEFDAPLPPSKLDNGLTSKVIRTGKPLLVHNKEFEESAKRGEIQLIGTPSEIWMGAPLINGKEIIGVISVQNYHDANCYSENDKEFLASVSSQVALAIDRKRAEEALHESEEQFRNLVTSSPIGILILKNSKCIFANPAGLRLIGFISIEELEAANILDVVHPKSRNLVLEKLKVVQKNIDNFGQLQNNPAIQITLQHKDGQVLVIEAVSTFQKINNEMATLIFCQDITARKNAEEEIRNYTDDLKLIKTLTDSVSHGDSLEKSLKLLDTQTKQLFSSYGSTVYLLSPDNNYLEMQSFQMDSVVVRWIEKRIGIKIPKVRIKMNEQSIYHQILNEKKFRLIEDPDKILELMYEFTDNKLYRKLIPEIYKTLKIHTVIAIPLISGGESVGLLELSSGTFFNQNDLKRLEILSSELGSIIRRKQAEEALIESEGKFRQIVERSNDIFIRQNFSNMMFEYVSPKAYDLLGYTPEELIQFSQAQISDVIHPDDLSIFDNLRKSLLETIRVGNHKFEREFRIRNKKNEYVWFHGNYTLILDEKGNPQLIVCTLTDISSRKINESIINARIKLMQLAQNSSLQELLTTALDEMENLSNSKISFFYIINEDQETMTAQAWSTKTLQDCKVEHYEKNFSLSDISVWVESIKNRQPVIHNNFSALTTRKQFPAGHLKVDREMVIPIFRNGKIVAVIGLGNKPLDYTQTDLEIVGKFADMAWDVVENKLIDEALKESEAIFNAFMENSPIYVFFKDKEIRSKQLSRNYEQMLGKPMDELLNKNMDELFPSDFAKNMVKDDQRILNEGKSIIVDEELNGRFYTTIKFPIFKDGKPEYLAGFTIDITDRVLSEKKLAESEELYRLISSVVSDYLFSTRIDAGNNPEMNWVAGAFEAITGYSIAEYEQIGGWRALVYPEDYPIDDRDFQNLLENKKVITELRLVKKDGSIVWVRSYAQPIWDETQNRLAGINGAVQDITERKKAEEEIKKSAKEFEVLYDTANDFSLHRDPNVILRTITDRACSLFEVTNAFVYIYDADHKELELKFSKIETIPIGSRFKLGEGFSGVVAATQRSLIVDDYESWPDKLQQFKQFGVATIMAVPMIYGGQLVGVLGVQEFQPSTRKFSESDAHFLSLFASQAAGAVYSADLFEQLRLNATELEKRVDERTKELQSKNKELETFTYTVSHDLKAPLRGISGYSTLLMEDHAGQLDEEGKRYLNNLVSSTERMNLLIEDLLTYSRIERREIKKTNVDLNELIDKIIVEYQSEITSGNLHIKKEIEYGTLLTDQEAISQALRNIIDNAVKFSKGRKDPEILIQCNKLEDHFLISVEDNGIGFDMKYYDKIFEIFQRLHLSEEYPGTGVGLAVVRKAIERLGGKIWAVSEPGVGSTFFMEFPI